MAFLDNSGDIILDAVLTDTGRMRLAKGDGSFRIAKFALGDDEIDYSLYNYSNTSGTAYFDLEVLQTPVLEAFSNNAASMKSKLISIARNNLLYLPVIKANTFAAPPTKATSLVQNGFVLTVDEETEDYFAGNGNKATYATAVLDDGVLYGLNTTNGKFVRVDQGLDTTEISPPQGLDPDLIETQFLIEIDNRFAAVADPVNGNVATPSYIDDDNIATYYFSRGVNEAYVKSLSTDNTTTAQNQILAGPRGTKLEFKLKSQLDVSSTDYLFNTLGTQFTINQTTGFYNPSVIASNIRGILTNIRVIGVTTGNSIDIPLMLIKKIS